MSGQLSIVPLRVQFNYNSKSDEWVPEKMGNGQLSRLKDAAAQEGAVAVKVTLGLDKSVDFFGLYAESKNSQVILQFFNQEDAEVPFNETCRSEIDKQLNALG